MGVVYLAEDTKLSRKVALKVLPAELSESESRRKRFEREAKAVAAFNHPNIVTVYSVEKDDGVHFITVELVRGKTLEVGNRLHLAIHLHIRDRKANQMPLAFVRKIAHCSPARSISRDGPTTRSRTG
jgi:serine/threonine-protein kinase